MLPVQRFLSFASENNLFSDGRRVLLAVSGGKDSVFMAQLFNEAGVPFGIAHCNFGLRAGDAMADEEFTADLAKQLDAPFHSTRFDTSAYARQKKQSVQMAARELRYDWLEDIRKTFDYECIAIAHHQSDSTETVLLNLVRGTGIQGLHGILPKRDRLIRPLLFMGRAEIDDLAEKLNIAYREDQSNASDKYKRNKIRHNVIPVLKELNPALDQTFSENSRRFSALEELLALTVENLRDKLFKEERQEVHVAISDLNKLHPKQLLVSELFRKYGFSEQVISDLLRSLHKHPGLIFYSSSWQILLDRGRLILRKQDNEPAELMVEGPGEVCWGSRKFRITTSQDTGTQPGTDNGRALFDADKIRFPLTIRSWKEGDHIVPLGMKGKKKLSDLFTSLKIPRTEKKSIPVFENANGDIFWLAGYRISDRYKVSPQTKKVIIFESYD